MQHFRIAGNRPTWRSEYKKVKKFDTIVNQLDNLVVK